MTEDELTVDEPMHEALTRQMRAAETKKRRTREKLIQAADHVMREEGFAATVEAIAEDAGISTATYYTFYRSRNLLCLDAFIEIVVVPLEELGVADHPFTESVEALLKQCEDRSALVRAALVGRFEEVPNDLVNFSKDEFLERVAKLLASHWEVGRYHGPDIVHGKQAYHRVIARMAALFILDSIATNRRQPYDLGEIYALMKTTLPSSPGA